MSQSKEMVDELNVHEDIDVVASSGSSSDKVESFQKRKRKTLKKESVPKMEGKKKSIVWTKFEKFKDENGSSKAKCIFCGKVYAAHPIHNGTSSMCKHLPVCPKDPDNMKKEKNIFQKKESEGDLTSGTIRTWRFDQEFCRKALMKMVIIDELPFSYVEKEGFKEFVEAICPTFVIPSRYTVSRDCVKLYLDEKVKLKNFFQKTKQRVSLTTDTWTSNQMVNYMCLTAHFIDDNWVLHKRIINFTPIFSHKGEEIGRAVESCLHEWGISNVMTITVDNASSNDVAISYLRRRLESCVLKGKFLHMRCVAHIINLVVRDGLKEHDESILRVRSAVRFMRQSPSRLEKFKDCVKECGIVHKSLLRLDCPTRWNSTFDMLDTSEKFEKAFTLYELRDVTYKLDLGDTYGVPDKEDWQSVRKFAIFLKLFYKLTNKISGSLYVTSNTFYDQIIEVDMHLRTHSNNPDWGTRVMALKMREKFDKYWGSIEKMNMLLYVAVVLDPRHKMEYLEFSFRNLYKKNYVNDESIVAIGSSESQEYDLCNMMIELVRSTTFDLFYEYKGKYGPSPQPSPTQANFFESFDESETQMNLMFNKHKLGGGSSSMGTKSELVKYLEEQSEDNVSGFDILLWWKNNSPRFPILSKMAKDVFAIPISTVASESAFSTGGRVLDNFRSSLSPPVVEALICTQDWIRKSRKQINVEEDLENIDTLGKELCQMFKMDETRLPSTSLGGTHL